MWIGRATLVCHGAVAAIGGDADRVEGQGSGVGPRVDVHWSFKAPSRPPVPQPIDTAWSRNPIDAFVLERLEQENLRPAPTAPRALLLRRVALDLTGLPPSEDFLGRYASGIDDASYRRAVEELMASPAYAERQAQDIVNGLQHPPLPDRQRPRGRPRAVRSVHPRATRR